MRAEALKGHLDGLLLAALEDGPRHGYAVKETLREATEGRIDLPTGTIYPALHRLERAGLIAGDWSVVGGR
ncbi:helix-turn-helix transcriptional regulator, partial [Nonomuraea fuscirosea]